MTPKNRALCDTHYVSPNLLGRARTRGAGGRAAPPPALAPGTPLAAFLAQSPAPAALRVLPSMPVRALRAKLLKALAVPRARHAAARVWMLLPDGHFVPLGDEHAARDLAYWGVEDGTRFVLAEE